MSLYKFAYTDVKTKEKKTEEISQEELEKLLNEGNNLESLR